MQKFSIGKRRNGMVLWCGTPILPLLRSKKGQTNEIAAAQASVIMGETAGVNGRNMTGSESTFSTVGP